MERQLGNLDLNLLVPLQALLRERNVTKAAAQVGLTQPAMSSALRRIRLALGDEILVRGPTGFRLTPRAEFVAEAVDDALRTIEKGVLMAPDFDAATSIRRFTIGASNATIFAALRPTIAASAARNPRISFSFQDVTRSPDTMLERPDLDLLLLPDVLPTVHAREQLYEERWTLVVSADNTRVGDRLTVEDLQALPHAVYESDGLRTHAELTLASVGGGAQSVVVTPDFMTLFHIIAGTDLIGCVQSRLATALAERNGLRIVQPPIPLPRFGIDMVVNPSRRSDSAIQWLLSELRASVGTPALDTTDTS